MRHSRLIYITILAASVGLSAVATDALAKKGTKPAAAAATTQPAETAQPKAKKHHKKGKASAASSAAPSAAPAKGKKTK